MAAQLKAGACVSKAQSGIIDASASSQADNRISKPGAHRLMPELKGAADRKLRRRLMPESSWDDQLGSTGS
jgi:hypothetical protein